MEGKRAEDSKTEQIHLIQYPDLNSVNRLFGGHLLSWIDEVAALTARRHCGHNAITAAIDNLQFKSGAYLNEMVVIEGKVTYTGHTSMEIRVDTYKEGFDGNKYVINRAYLVMVAIGEDNKPIEIPPLIIETPSEKIEWENALKRKELRLLRKQEGF